MFRLKATLLLAALVSAEFTTYVWMPKIGNSNKYGYVASVIDADEQHLTMTLDYDNKTDTSALNLGGNSGNYTFGPSGFTINQAMTRLLPEITGDSNLRVQCTEPSGGQYNPDVQCTQMVGDGYARFFQCNEYQVTRNRTSPPNITSTYPHTYGTGLWGSSGTETITYTLNFPQQTVSTTPAWCTSDAVPASVLTVPYTTRIDQFAVYQVVVTAGEEKLSAYSSSERVLSTITFRPSAGSSGSAIASATATTPPANTGAAGRLNAAAPALAGLGVAAVMGMV
ncbi:hypothetical protein N0V95_001894 [Ascochyta clinopodiicola]|nr:hypothetical protein N0V95_001894 [Ascochyta clinopodiicola]